MEDLASGEPAKISEFRERQFFTSVGDFSAEETFADVQIARLSRLNDFVEKVAEVFFHQSILHCAGQSLWETF